MEQTIINIPVCQAKNLDPFTNEGKRYLNFHYFQLTETGWLFRWIEEETDVKWLLEKIEEGAIYIIQQ